MVRILPESLDPNSPDYGANPAVDPGHLHSTLGGVSRVTAGAIVYIATPTSGTEFQPDTTADREVYVGTTTAGSAVVALSADDSTFTTVQAITLRATDCISQFVPKGWWLKITLTTSTFVSNKTFVV